jgi:hypothetical protein
MLVPVQLPVTISDRCNLAMGFRPRPLLVFETNRAVDTAHLALKNP